MGRKLKLASELSLEGTPAWHEPRFWIKVSRTPKCWFWLGSTDKDGYGRFKLEGRNHLAHRLSYVKHKGRLRANQDVHHTCHNRACVNPKHLEKQPRLRHRRTAKTDCRTDPSDVAPF